MIDYLKEKQKADKISKIVCEFYNEDIIDVFKNSRKRNYVFTRQVIHYFLEKYTKLSLEKIGNHFDYLGFKRDHATIIHSCKTINNLSEVDSKISNDLERIEFKVKQALIVFSEIKRTPEEKMFYNFRSKIYSLCRKSTNKEKLVNELIAIL